MLSVEMLSGRRRRDGTEGWRWWLRVALVPQDSRRSFTRGLQGTCRVLDGSGRVQELPRMGC